MSLFESNTIATLLISSFHNRENLFPIKENIIVIVKIKKKSYL